MVAADAAPKPLHDLQREETNPRRAALRVCTDMLTKPFQETHFSNLARAFAPGRTPEERAEVSALVRSAGVNIVTHVCWRFAAPLAAWQCNLVRVGDPGLSAAVRADVSTELLGAPDRDLGRDFAPKVEKL